VSYDPDVVEARAEFAAACAGIRHAWSEHAVALVENGERGAVEAQAYCKAMADGYIAAEVRPLWEAHFRALGDGREDGAASPDEREER
jgi:hypothetical protein